MDKNAIKTPETHTDELISALKVVSEIVIGPELRTLKEFIRTTDESRQVDLSNMEERMETALAKIREDAMAISADLRHTKADMETDRKKWSEEITKWNEEITNTSSQLHETSEDMIQKISDTETSLQTKMTKLKEQTAVDISNLTQDHVTRFTNVEGRVTRCENEATTRREENNRLAQSLSSVAESLVNETADQSPTSTSDMKQVDTFLNELDEVEPEVKEKKSEKSEMPDFDAVFNAIET